MQQTVPSALGYVGLRLADTQIGAHVAGSGRLIPMLMGEPAMWTDTPKRMGGRNLVSKERAGALRCSTRQRDRLYPGGIASSSLNFSDGWFTRIDLVHNYRLEIHWSGDAEGLW